jgi:hypothetical protein
MKRLHLAMLTSALFVLAAAAPAFAQGKGITGRSEEAMKNDAAYDAQYRSRRGNDEAAPKADPWGTVRTQASQPTAPATATATAGKKAKN